MKALIRGGRLVDPVAGIGGVMDILIEDGMIAIIGDHLDEPDAEVLDASGLIVCAGLVDMHTHLRDPGQTEKEDLESGLRAAAKGGFTSIACMANTAPVIDTPELVRDVAIRADRLGLVNLYPIAAVTQGLKGETLTDFAALRGAGAAALSDDGAPLQRAAVMRDALICATRPKMTILTHCEDETLVCDYAVNEGRVSRQLGLPGRPAIAEELMVMRDVMLAEETGGRVHICHVSTRGSVEIIRQAKKRGVQVTCETCPHYFMLSEDELLKKESMARVNPPLRSQDDVDAVIAGLRDGTIDVIASDHAPHTAAEKAKKLAEAPSGISGLETSLAVSLTALYHGGMMSLSELLRKMTYNPAMVLGIPKGRVGLGLEADFTLFDPMQEWTVDPAAFVSKGHNTPFAGKTLSGRVKYTIVAGRTIYQEARDNVH